MVFLLDLADYEQVQIVFSYLKLIRKLAISRLGAIGSWWGVFIYCMYMHFMLNKTNSKISLASSQRLFYLFLVNNKVSLARMTSPS